MRGLSGMSSKKKKTICFLILVLAAVSASVVFASMAAERAGMYWIGLDNRSVVEKTVDNRGFIMVDVSDLSSMYAPENESSEGTEIVPIGIGPLPSVPSLTTAELKLYGILSRGDGLILSEDKNALDEDIHWQEVILEPGDTLASVAKNTEYLQKIYAARMTLSPMKTLILIMCFMCLTAKSIFSRPLRM